MSLPISLLAVTAITLSCIGFGIGILRVFRAQNTFESHLERIALAFALGLGFTGWVLFFPGIYGAFRSEVFWGLVSIGSILLIANYRQLDQPAGMSDTTWAERALFALLCVVLCMDLMEGIAPPADADTLSYHFALPRDFVVDAQVSFVARVVTGAIPLLLHMTYGAAYGLGGETALTLWTMITGWAAAFVLYAVSRQSLSRVWSLTLTILFLTTPAVLYGAGSGQVEIRCAIFVLASVRFVILADREQSYRLLILAGICAGYFMGSKYFGLIFVGATGLFLLIGRDKIRRGLIFGSFATVVGFQWYFWNWLHTGDPIFPVLTEALNRPDTWFWTHDFNTYFTQLSAAAEMPLSRSFGNWLLYPVYSLFNTVGKLEGGRTGLGMLIVIAFPLFLAGLCNRNIRRWELAVPLIISGIFYTVWFFGGGTQRTRHLLPIYPILLLGVLPVAVTVCQRFGLTRIFSVGIGAILCIQITGQALFTVNYGKFIFSKETRAEFLERNVSGANAAFWINSELPEGAKLGFMFRGLAYLIERPSFMLHPHYQAVFDTRPTSGDARQFVSQLQAQKITHILLSSRWWLSEESADKPKNFNPMIRRLVMDGCLNRLKLFKTVSIPSRTLKQLDAQVLHTRKAVFYVAYRNCPLYL